MVDYACCYLHMLGKTTKCTRLIFQRAKALEGRAKDDRVICYTCGSTFTSECGFRDHTKKMSLVFTLPLMSIDSIVSRNFQVFSGIGRACHIALYTRESLNSSFIYVARHAFTFQSSLQLKGWISPYSQSASNQFRMFLLQLLTWNHALRKFNTTNFSVL